MPTVVPHLHCVTCCVGQNTRHAPPQVGCEETTIQLVTEKGKSAGELQVGPYSSWALLRVVGGWGSG